LRSGPQTENNINRAVMARSQIPGRMNPIDLGNCRDLAGASLSCAFITSPLTLLILCHPLPIIIMSSPSPKRRDSSPAPEPAKKRRRGATRLSCAECRRLKLRCDRGIPCGSCVKRGCGAICPDGNHNIFSICYMKPPRLTIVYRFTYHWTG